jgi:outer membrane protein assembly factor BamB
MKSALQFSLGVALALCLAPAPAALAKPARGWLSWRGPRQNGTSLETGLPDKIDPAQAVWTADFPGQSTPIIANGRVYIIGYTGEGPELVEGVACFDAETGKQLWRKMYTDFLSDTIYLRYATSSATVDPETGNICIQGTQGMFACLTPDGKTVWEKSLMELYGRLTFPNARTASPAIDSDLVIARGITANWGAQGPGADRFYAFDKNSGELVWASSPGAQPKDNSFSHPVFANWKGMRVFYSATGDGSVVCVNARTGDPLWRTPLFKAGINASLLVYNDDTIISIFGTPYEPGRMVAMKIPDVLPQPMSAGPVVIDPETVTVWKNELRTSSSSPILVGDKIYLVNETGDLVCVDAKTGNKDWKLKVGIEQRNACPLFADGKLYVPMLNEPGVKDDSAGEATAGKGAFYVIKPGATNAEVISHAVLDGRCFGTPTAWNGKIYIQTGRKLYCFGRKGGKYVPPADPEPVPLTPGPATQLQIIPNEVLLHPGQKVGFRVRELDAHGLTVKEVKDINAVKWAHYIPPTAKVRASMKAEFTPDGKLVAENSPTPSAGAFEATLGDLKGTFRGRVLPGLPIKQDFESFTLTETNVADNALFAYPPLPWIGARFKFEVREKDGNKVLVKTTDNPFFRRATVFMGDPVLKNYTIEADVMSDGNKRKMSEVGLINQRYRVVLKGNDQKLEVASNEDLLHVGVPFKWTPGMWYHLKTRVDVIADGSGVVRAKAWKKGEEEPGAWTIEVPVKIANQEGCPGLFSFSPQDMKAYVDNVLVTAN